MTTHARHMYNIAEPQSTFFLIFLIKFCNWNKTNCAHSGALYTWDIPNDADRLIYTRLFRKFFMRHLFWSRYVEDKNVFSVVEWCISLNLHTELWKKTFIVDLYFWSIFSFSYFFILCILLHAKLEVLNSYK
jgi:hypothetical protein